MAITVTGTCKDCAREGYLYSRNSGLCKVCYMNKKKLTFLDAHPVKKKRRAKRIKPRSKSMSVKMIEYNKLRLEYLADHEICEVRTCNMWATDIHHKRSRGKYLLDVSTWMAVCRLCHQRITDDSAWAIKNNYSIKRNGI